MNRNVVHFSGGDTSDYVCRSTTWEKAPEDAPDLRGGDNHLAAASEDWSPEDAPDLRGGDNTDNS